MIHWKRTPNSKESACGIPIVVRRQGESATLPRTSRERDRATDYRKSVNCALCRREIDKAEGRVVKKVEEIFE